MVDTTKYHPELRDGRIDVIDRGMLESQSVAQQLGHPVIKALNNIFATSPLAAYRADEEARIRKSMATETAGGSRGRRALIPACPA